MLSYQRKQTKKVIPDGKQNRVHHFNDMPMQRATHIKVISIFLFLLGMILFFLTGITYAHSVTYSVKVQWNQPSYLQTSRHDSVKLISFAGCTDIYYKFGTLPVYTKRYPLPDGVKDADVELINLKFIPLQQKEITGMRDIDRIPGAILLDKTVTLERGKSYLSIDILPLRKNPVSGEIEKLAAFDLKVNYHSTKSHENVSSGRNYADHSVLASGTWYKLAVNATGIYRITYSDLVNMGITPGTIDPRNIRIFGNGGGMLPEANSVPRPDDLVENAIYVSGESDGQFNDGDYILFYGESTDKWYFNNNDHLFHHSRNVYSDYSDYFLTYDQGPGKRTSSLPVPSASADFTIDRFNDYALYEKDDLNLIKSGREWYDQDVFDVTTTRPYTFGFPNLDSLSAAFVTVDLAARSTAGPTNFTLSANEHAITSLSIPPTTDDWLAEYAKKGNKTINFNTSGGDALTLTLNFNKNGQEATGYLNYIEMNVVRELKMAGAQMPFRSITATAQGKVYEYKLTTQGQQIVVWDVTNPAQIHVITPDQQGASYNFRVTADSTIHEFVAFDGSNFNSVHSATKIENQDLHGAGLFDYVIITYPDFRQQAEELAQFHRDHDQFTVLVTTPEKVYNEFSSGAQDISAIRDFMKMMYDRSSGTVPKYLLLFGDASYDYKDRIQNNSNLIPTFESPESLDPVDSYVTDDYFVLMDNNEGQNATGALDIGVGRFPVQTQDDANAAIAKIKQYCLNSDSVKNDWRNIISFVADDWDNNLHLMQTEELTSMIEQNYKKYNVDKIYIDAYQALPTPGGLRNPDVNDAITKRVNKGALLMNYTGHGGELGWAHERVLEIADIKSWTNIYNMPAFVTATCEFSRFDDPSWISAGEWVFLNPVGGGIALFTTTRPTFAGANAALTTNFYNNVFNKVNGHFPRMGDLIVDAKNTTGGSANSRKFVLLGDPALQLAYPQYNVVTDSFNLRPVSVQPDTLSALSVMTVSGSVQDDAGVIMSEFNGTLFPTVYDKASRITTLGNTGGPITSFYLQKNVIYKGKVEVSKGRFTFTFIVPKDIAYTYGPGKITYYARSKETDANGVDADIIVGGYNNSAITDQTGPAIHLFMNDTNFVSGGLTSQNPTLLAFLSDSAGINTVGNGIGHDITVILDDNTQDLHILNDYYVSDVNTFRSGIIRYPYTKLPDGEHEIRLKAWDVYNNSTEATIQFIVASSADFILQHLMNYPNPFRYNTTFSFEFNQASTPMNVEINIYSLNGELLKRINQPLNTNGFRWEISWDGTTDSGRRIGSGTYVYAVKLILPNGTAEHLSSKLVIIR